MEEVYEQKKRGPTYQVPEPNFYEHIWDIFDSTWVMSWLNGHAKWAHGMYHCILLYCPRDELVTIGAKAMAYPFHSKEEILSNPGSESRIERQRVFKAIRVPVVPKYEDRRRQQANSRYMPRMSGDGGKGFLYDRITLIYLTQRRGHARRRNNI